MANPNDFLKKIELAASCPICLEVFEVPYSLPTCGHSYCRDCLERVKMWSPLWKRFYVRCPECRANSNFEEIGDLKTNLYAKQIADIVREQKLAKEEEKNMLPEADGKVCPHGSALQVPAVHCKHCNRQLCQACLYEHMEEIRIATASAAVKFTPRIEQACQKFESKRTVIAEFIDKSVSETESRIHSSFQALEQAIFLGLEASKERLVEQVRRLAANRKRKLEEAAKDALPDSALAKRASKMINTSIVQCSLDSILQLHSDACAQNNRISRLESIAQISDPKDLFDLKCHIDSDGVESDLLNTLKAAEDNFFQLAPFKPEEKPGLHDFLKDVHCAAQLGDLESLKAILQDGNLPPLAKSYFVGHKDDSGTTPLMQACYSGHIDVVKFLVLDCEANLMACDRKGFMPIHHAVTNGHVEVIHFLLNIKPDLIMVAATHLCQRECQHFDRLKPIFEKKGVLFSLSSTVD